jgi:hypothetical protein
MESSLQRLAWENDTTSVGVARGSLSKVCRDPFEIGETDSVRKRKYNTIQYKYTLFLVLNYSYPF